MASSVDPSTPAPSAPPADTMPAGPSTYPSTAQIEDDHFPTDFEFTLDDDGHSHDASATASPPATAGTSSRERTPYASNTTAGAAAAAGTQPTDGDDTADGPKKDDPMFECNICLDTAKEAVVSMCGHLFCWPCLHQWLETRPTRQLCPVCKAAISREKVIPLYGRGSTKQEDPRSKVPPRPAGQRTEPEPHAAFQGFGFSAFSDGGFQMMGIGGFPFGIFGSTFSFGTNLRTQNANTNMHLEDEQFLSKAFLWVTIIFLGWLIFVA